MLHSMNAAGQGEQTVRLDIVGEMPAIKMGRNSAGETVTQRHTTIAELTTARPAALAVVFAGGQG